MNAQEKSLQIRYFKALLDGHMATADFLEARDPWLGYIIYAENMKSSMGHERAVCHGEIVNAR